MSRKNKEKEGRKENAVAGFVLTLILVPYIDLGSVQADIRGWDLEQVPETRFGNTAQNGHGPILKHEQGWHQQWTIV
jgi:hypothetical protein